MAKRLICVIISVLMIISLLPTGAFATEDTGEAVLAVSENENVEENEEENEEEPEEVTVSEAAQAVQAAIDALPTVDEVAAMDTEGQNEVYAAFLEACEAYDALSEEEQATVDDSALYTLSDYFNGLISVAADVAQIGDTTYSSLADAFTAAAGTEATITLLSSITLSSAITISSGNIIFDLNGYTITSTATSRAFMVQTAGTLTIRDSSEAGTGAMKTSQNYLLRVGAGGTLIIESGTFTITSSSTSNSSAAVYVSSSGDAATVYIKGGSLSGYRTVTLTGSSAYCYISGGTIYGRDTGVNIMSNSSVTITDGTITGVNYGVKLQSGSSADLEGGTYTATATGGVSAGVYSGTCSLNITGGTYNTNVEEYVSDESSMTYDSTTGLYTVGEAATYVASVTINGVTTSYETFAEAVSASYSSSAATITLLADVDISSSATATTINGSDVTLDLNGHALKVANTYYGSLWVTGKLTLTDSTDTAEDGSGSGKIFTETTYTGSTTGYGVINVYAGEFVMESGYVYAVIEDNPTSYGQYGVTTLVGGTITINGGKIEAGWYAIAGSGNDDDDEYASTITVNGGYLISTADYAIYHPQAGTLTVTDGTIYGAAGGIYMNRGTLNVSGGTVTSKGTGNTGTWGDGTGNSDAAALNVNARYGNVSVTITDGTFTAETGALIITSTENYTASVAISGGYFSQAVDEEYCADGYVPTDADESTGLYTVTKLYLGVSSTEDDVPVTTIVNYGESTMYVGVSASDIKTYYSIEKYPTTSLTITSTGNKYIFAGWYEDSEGKTACTSIPTTDAYAKFVDANVLTVKAQLPSDYTTSGDTTTLRFISSVDTLDYYQAGFKITIGSNSKTVVSTTVYSKIVGTDGTTIAEYNPNTVFSSESTYFVTCTLSKIPYASYGTTITVQAMWITLDGTTVYGESRDFTVSGVYSATSAD